MGNVQSNITLGREVELYDRINSNDPANSALRILALALTGLVEDDVLKTYDTVAALLAGASNEVTNGGYGRLTLTDADLAAYTVNDTAHTITLVLPLLTFPTVAAGDTWGKIVTAYVPDTTAPSDATLVPLTYHDALDEHGDNIVPNGNDIEVDLTAGFVVAK